MCAECECTVLRKKLEACRLENNMLKNIIARNEVYIKKLKCDGILSSTSMKL